MRDEDLLHMAQTVSAQYTPFAIEAARREVNRRGGMDALKKRIKEGRAPSSIREPDYIKAYQEAPSVRGVSTGCYIDVWHEKNFEGDSLRIEGPGAIPDLCSNDLGWCSRISSLRVGPQAFVLAYADKSFKGDMIRLGPSEEVTDMHNVKFSDEIDSLKIVDSLKVFDCTNTLHDHLFNSVASSNENPEGQGTAGSQQPGQDPNSRRRHKRDRD